MLMPMLMPMLMLMMRLRAFTRDVGWHKGHLVRRVARCGLTWDPWAWSMPCCTRAGFGFILLRWMRLMYNICSNLTADTRHAWRPPLFRCAQAGPPSLSGHARTFPRVCRDLPLRSSPPPGKSRDAYEDAGIDGEIPKRQSLHPVPFPSWTC